MENILDPNLRKIMNADSLIPYERYGSVNSGLEWKQLSGATGSGYECFFIRFKPGGKSVPHLHSGGEEFFVVEGSLTDCDGTVYKAGDFVRFDPGSKHMSYSASGCLLLTIIHGENIEIDTDLSLGSSLLE